METLKKFGEYAGLLLFSKVGERRFRALHIALTAGAFLARNDPAILTVITSTSAALYANRLETNAEIFDKAVTKQYGSSFNLASHRPLMQIVTATLWAPVSAAYVYLGATAPPQDQILMVPGLGGFGLIATAIKMAMDDAGGVRSFFRRQPRQTALTQ